MDPNKFQNFDAAQRKINMVRFGLFPADFNLSWIDGASATGATLLGVDFFVTNGVTTVFTLTYVPGTPDMCFVYLNGQLLKRGVDYTLSGTTLTTTSFIGDVTDVLTAYTFA